MRASALLFVLLTGCGFDDHRAGELCPDEGSCGPGLVCVRGLCAVPGPDRGTAPPAVVPDARPDATTAPRDAAPVEDADLPPDARRPPAEDAFVPRPDAFVPPPPPPDAFVPPPPPPDAALPPPMLPDGPQLGLPGCRGDAWCVYADADATVLESEPDQNVNWLLGVSNGWDGVPDGEGLIRFRLGELAGREAFSVGIYLDTSYADGGREGRPSRLQVDLIESGWDERTVTWRTQLRRLAGPQDVQPPRGAPAAPVRWEVIGLVAQAGEVGVRLPEVVSFRLHEEGNGRYLFVSREEAAERRDRLPPRLELMLVPRSSGSSSGCWPWRPRPRRSASSS
ncbi:MAG: DNRLRE domain-containing protein [bacterium]